MIKKMLIVFSILITIVITPFIGGFFYKEDYIKLNREIKSPVFDRYNEKTILLFFGYVGCADICTPKLDELSSAYENIKAHSSDIKVLFINLSKLQDPELADMFAKSFNRNFEGIYLQKKELDGLKKEFKVYSTQALGDPDEIDHSAFVYQLEKAGSTYYLKKIYTKTSPNISVENLQE